MTTTTKPRCQDLRPGQAIQYTYTSRRRRSQPTVIVNPPQYIDRRKDDDSGWWLTDRSGIADWVFDKGDEWQVVTA